MIKAQHTIASPASILKVIQRHYPAIGASDCQLLALGCNDNFHIKGKRRDYAFRHFRLDWWPEKDVDEELRFLETMHRHKLNINKPVRTAKKQRYIKTITAEGMRYGALFSFIPGRPLGFNYGNRNSNMVQLGGLVAKIHSAADKMKQPIQRWTIDFDTFVTPFINNAHVVLGHREKDLNYLSKLAGKLKDVIFEQPEGSLNFGLCHGDLHTHNVMLQPDGELAIFDFDWCGYSWRAYDLATVWWSLPCNDKSKSAWRAFLRGYTQSRKLSRQEQKLMPWFVLFRYFEYLNFQLTMRSHIGTAWLSDNYYDYHIKAIKGWEKSHITK